MGHIGTNGIDKIPQKVTQAANNPPGQRPEEDSGKDNRQGPKANPDPLYPANWNPDTEQTGQNNAQGYQKR